MSSDLFSTPPEKHPLRDYQKSAVDVAISWCKYKSEQPCIIDMATGAGKSHIIAALMQYYFNQGKRVCMLAHRKELLEQTGSKIAVPFGYYSASIVDKDTDSQVIVGGIQSVYNKEFEKFDVIIIDECHRVTNNTELGRYWQFIDKHRPCAVIGLTATPFRLEGGKLGWGEIIYEAKYPLLLEQGYLAPMTNKVKNTPDLSSVKVTAGEYNETDLADVMESPELIALAIKNIIAYSEKRHSILIFCVTVSHAKVLTDAMQKNGLASALIHGETKKEEREAILRDYKDGKLRHLLNCEVLLEGFDAPNTDMIVCLRPTKSKALWEQLLGRGVRKAEGKEDCFVLDMAGNLMEHGGLGTPFWDRSRKEGEKTPGRICPECETYCKATARECPDCGYIFPEPEKKKASHNATSDTQSNAVFVPLEDYEVVGVRYRKHINKQGKESLRVDYICNTKYGAISEWYSPHNESEWARNKAAELFSSRGNALISPIESYSYDDLIFHAEKLKKPLRITVDHNAKFPRIIRYEYDEDESRSSNTASVDPLAALEDDVVPF